jgi:hypothetical protein
MLLEYSLSVGILIGISGNNIVAIFFYFIKGFFGGGGGGGGRHCQKFSVESFGNNKLEINMLRP